MRLLFVIAFFLTFALNLLAQKATIIVYDRVAIEGSTVQLGDIAAVFGTDENLKKRLNHILLATMPNPGAKTQISRRDIEVKLKAAGFSLDALEITGTAIISVQRPSGEPEKNPLARIVESFIGGYYELSGEEYSLEFRNLPEAKKMPSNGRLLVIPASSQKYKGNTVVVVGLKVNGEIVKKYPVSAKIRTYDKIAVAIHDVDRWDSLKVDDFTLMRRETTGMRREPVKDLRELANQRASNRIFPGEVLTMDDMEPIPVIKKGEIVKMTVKDEMVKVSTLGRARESGGIGEIIPVVNLDSHKIINARIVAEGIVEVNFTAYMK